MSPRSWLYVPGHRAERIPKAIASAADAVVIDLEDAVPVDAKERALEHAVAALQSAPAGRTIWLRLNAIGSQWLAREIDVLSGADCAPAGVRLPKAESPETVAATTDRLGCPVHAIVESAAGLLAAPQIARCHSRVTGIALGEADLAADLRTAPEGLAWARGWIVAAARAAGLSSPVQSVWTAVDDPAGLAASSHAGRIQGFFGRSVIHPDQIDIVNEAYTPSAEEQERAQRIVDDASASLAAGESAVLDENGRFIDPAVVANARVVLDRAQAVAARGVEA
ncbi:HpcH/HpaI aldolase/citrate lyase family protein [Rhodococcus sp. SGAir0479]|uniref:HpcH/HpaI aldolase/citrate lyase family protein n=1 Tax=Rhodococcus sp. SGAir0479 TaxID=2567884 RepID=UPI0010CD62BF|nr:CoA ester lyase [Rhodococcus sp. SGAir0479]QCQ90236.1 CoA ester lyase [Rhodococcus sp. SGAir0479]